MFLFCLFIYLPVYIYIYKNVCIPTITKRTEPVGFGQLLV